MTTPTDSLAHCKPCNGKLPALTQADIKESLAGLNEAWTLSADSKSITRRFEFKGFAKAVYTVNLCSWLADREGHHPDIAFGWGYCQVTLTTHDIDGLSENDFIWATRLDALVI
ncbi:4a-hydroxytetrahydrobiopterin dehydratase [Granulosicoccus antarcticus]|uniref:Putative pterin-4-alpha-carbinolamine dehydratase n=1 Tax=Granulosicoccus antarcticus IMCC3135 TaxID=1192854 RepID=A0A2Z2NR41_9GAMM|nr:4a-hydroxytetrahydrobiopterin dehydratase [Granulosicoccus antarcticus]ASJ73956.1 Putative pterin-4-alpha-carbinolamine dehydratase [Granulosicoccus antarcticus IMCC3135]